MPHAWVGAGLEPELQLEISLGRGKMDRMGAGREGAKWGAGEQVEGGKVQKGQGLGHLTSLPPSPAPSPTLCHCFLPVAAFHAAAVMGGQI